MPRLLDRLNVANANCIEVITPQFSNAVGFSDLWEGEGRIIHSDALAIYMLTFFEPFDSEWREQGVSRERWVLDQPDRFIPILQEIDKDLGRVTDYDFFLNPPAHPDSD